MKKLSPLKILEVGGIYQVKDLRKGEFEGKCLSVDGEWATFRVTKGVARFLSDGGYELGLGDRVTCRHTLCEYRRIPV